MLKTGRIYVDNAGGSQIPQDVVNRIAETCLVQAIGVQEGKEAATKLLNATSLDGIVFEGSSTANMDVLMKRLEAEGEIGSGDEIIVMAGEHEGG
ncbi:hypothetical protein PC9H_000041 [Pleurotus ostreatus]|uniref:Aminotransferase class V domain-containing protein n=1 Tax=Pleurotus ostreatus TaxID=5322 RepID=A0A8H7A0C3_PLEOS|nr:uncharacterized protein PC9H_000041 [Pleurotus ostreatus]KAF7439705.1 hypothetical protein PC9H_000041 [Pleurotus ostreatus]